MVHVFEGSTEVGKGKTTVSGGTWTATAETALPSGEHSYKVYANEKSGLPPNAEGKSEERTLEIDTDAPHVTLAHPTGRTNNTKPTFTGTGSENNTEVVVHIFEGSTEIGKGKATVSGNTWSASPEVALPSGERKLTVEATESSLIGNPEGVSAEAWPFELDTEPPVVTLQGPALVSSDREPIFEGSVSEGAVSEPVTVEVFKGSKAKVGEGALVKLVKQPSSGHYAVQAASALADGEYSAIAIEPSALGNKRGESKEVHFEVDTEAPAVELNAPSSPSNVTAPGFSGTVIAPKSETKPVYVYVYEGTQDYGAIVRKVEATVKGGAWSSPAVSPALPDGTYTAVAATESAIGNEIGKSKPRIFVIDTRPPAVTINQPTKRTNNTKPTFGGTAGEETEVVVHVLEAGTEVASGHTVASHGTWSTGSSSALPAGAHMFTVYTTEASGLGNKQGESGRWSFEVDTESPHVTLTALPTPSSSREPAFSGTANEDSAITVNVYRGAEATGAVVVSVKATVEGDEWFAGKLEKAEALEWGEYTAQATQSSAVGNLPGSSNPVHFVVAQIPPAVVTEAPTAIAESHAALYGTVNPMGGPVSLCEFEFGTNPTPPYGRTVRCGFVSEGLEEFPPTATGAVPVFVRVYGLRPSTLYHERVVASGEGGTGAGADMTFTTLPEEEVHSATPPATAPKPAADGVKAFAAVQVLPSGKSAKIAAILRLDAYDKAVRAPEAGALRVRWYYLPRGAKLGGQGRHAPVLIASGTVTFHAAQAARLSIHLTAVGRRMLLGTSQLRLTDTCSFVPVGGIAAVTSATFLLKR